MKIKTLKDRWTRDAIIAFNTKAYCGSFEMYWNLTELLRKNMPEVTICKMKTIKQAAWNAEEEKTS